METKKNPAGAGGAASRAHEEEIVTNNLQHHRVNVKAMLAEYIKAKGLELNSSGFIHCPFHQDEHPSCKVNSDYLYCFSCGETGDIFKTAAALIGVPRDKEHFRQIAADVERVLGLPEGKPPKRNGNSRFRLSQSAVYRSELLEEFAKAIDSGDEEQAYYRASLLLALFMLPEGEPERKKSKPSLRERMAGYAGYERGAHE